MAGEDAGAAFDLVTDETRVSILRALAAAHDETPEDPWLTYSELRERAGVRDKGNFNYHLDRLDELIVEGEDGYRLGAVGMDLVSTLAAEAFDPGWSWGPVDAPGTCTFCGDDLHLRYADGLLRLGCDEELHEAPLAAHPPLAADHDTETVASAASLLTQQEVDQVRAGVCPACHGRMAAELDHEAHGPDHWHLHGECERCGVHLGYPVGLLALREPRVQGALAREGVDVRERPFWTFEWCRPRAETVVSEDPVRLRVDVPVRDDGLSVLVDADGSVVVDPDG